MQSKGDSFQYSVELFLLPGFAFPYCIDFPAHSLQFFLFLLVSLHIFFEFLVPEIQPAFRSIGKFAAFVSMPEAPMDKNHGIVFWKNYIRFARQFILVQSETEAGFMQQCSYKNFGLCIIALNPAHVPASFFFRKCIGHVWKISFPPHHALANK